MSPSAMRLTAAILTGLVLLAGCGPTGDGPGKGEAKTLQETAPVDPQLLAEGKIAWRACAKCHCVTDPTIPEDVDWVAMNEETTCIAKGAPAPRLRQAIIAHLNNAGALRPVLIGEDAKAGAKKTGRITLPATAGSAYLRADRESVRAGSPAKVRLAWGASDAEKDATAPAGNYDVINFWFYRRVGDARWMVTGTNVNGCTTAAITPGDTELLDVEPLLHGKLAAKRQDGRYAISFSCEDTGGSRMTLSRNGRIIVPGYRITDDAGKVVAEGRFVVI